MKHKRYFVKKQFDIVKPIKPKQTGIHVEWIFDELKPEDIAKNENGTYAIMPGCGCTASIQVTDEKIVATYNDNTLAKTVKETVNREKVIGKTVRVYLKDEAPLMIKNNRGILVPNALGKKNVLLSFSAVVQV